MADQMSGNACLVDSHCHIDFPELFERREAVFARMLENGVKMAMAIGVNLEDFPKVLAVAESHPVQTAPHLFASVGVHPEYTDVEEPTVEGLCALAAHPRVLAIGETGLDYYWHKDQPAWQRDRFRTHIRAALACGKPLVIHTRNAAEDTLRVLAEEGAGRVGGIFHCFTETPEVAQAALDMGFHLSFSGIVTFRNAAVIKEVARTIPLDRLLVETDSPYLAPVPYRGKPNEPAYVRHVAEEIAKLRGLDVQTVAEATTANFLRLFPAAASALESPSP